MTTTKVHHPFVDPHVAPHVMLLASEDRPHDWPAPGTMHFRLTEPSLGELDLTCESGFVVTEYDLGFPQVREVSYLRTLDDGTFDLTRFVGARTVNLQITLGVSKVVCGPGRWLTPPSERQLRDRLLAYLHPARRPVLLFSELGDDLVRQVQLRGAQGGIPVSGPKYNRMSVSWVAPGGLLESYESRCYRISMDEKSVDIDGGLSLPIENLGNAPAHWTATLHGEAMHPTISVAGGQLHLTYDAHAGDTIVLASAPKSVTINDQRVGFKHVTADSTWTQVPPGVSVLRFAHKAFKREGYPFAYWQADSHATKWAEPPANGYPGNPAPQGAPPWAWSTDVDLDTGLPGITTLDFCFRSCWL